MASWIDCSLISQRLGGGRSCEALEQRTYLTAPVWSNFNFHHNPPFGQPQTQSITIDFNIDVRQGQINNPLENSDLTLQKVGPNDTFIASSSINLSNPAPGMQGTFTFTNQPPLPFSGGRTDILPDGNYRASISSQDLAAGTITEPEEMLPGNAVHDFFVLSADANHDRVVNLQDFNVLAANFGQAGRTFSQGNFNYSADGLVNLQDFNIFSAQFGASMPEPPTGPGQITVAVRPDFKFDLAWLDTVVLPAQEEGWRVQYSLNSDFSGAMIEDLPANSVGWTTDAFGDGTRVWFRSRAYGNGQDTAYTPKRYGITPLPQPEINSVVAISSSQIKITFTDNSQNEDNFRVLRATSLGGPYVHVGTVLPGQPTLQYIDFGLNPNTPYYYRVEAHNEVTGSAPSNFGSTTTYRATAFIDIDVFEDVNGDFIHDNSNAAEQLENTQPTELPFDEEEDGDWTKMAMIVNNVPPGATVSFSFEPNQLQLFRDIMGVYPISVGQNVLLSDFGISGSATVPIFAKATTNNQSPGGVSAQFAGGGSSGSNAALQGGTRRRTQNPDPRPDDPILHNGIDDGLGGLDDGDGPLGDPLTDRDGFWTTHQGKRTLIIGFAGHTQSLGKKGIEGQIWTLDIRLGRIPGVRTIGEWFRTNFENPPSNWAVTVFPEDPGNAPWINIDRCGDGVIGKANPNWGGLRLDALGNKTGALHFLIDAIKNRNVNRVGLFGYSTAPAVCEFCWKRSRTKRRKIRSCSPASEVSVSSGVQTSTQSTLISISNLSGNTMPRAGL